MIESLKQQWVKCSICLRVISEVAGGPSYEAQISEKLCEYAGRFAGGVPVRNRYINVVVMDGELNRRVSMKGIQFDVAVPASGFFFRNPINLCNLSVVKLERFQPWIEIDQCSYKFLLNERERTVWVIAPDGSKILGLGFVDCS